MKNPSLEILELYIEGKLSAEEKTAMEQHMLNDEQYRAYVHETILLIKGIKLSGRNELKSKLDQLEQKALKVSYRVPFRSKFFLYAAAAVIAFVLSVLAYRYIAKPETPQHVYAMYFTPYPNVVAPITREKPITGSVSEAFRQYESGHYANAIHLFNLLPDNNTDESLLFYNANAYMALGNTESALEIFKKQLPASRHFRQQILWYMALCYLHQEDIAHTHQIIEQMQAEFPENNNVKELYKRLKTIKNPNQ